MSAVRIRLSAWISHLLIKDLLLSTTCRFTMSKFHYRLILDILAKKKIGTMPNSDKLIKKGN
jgi:hypothetical protein